LRRWSFQRLIRKLESVARGGAKFLLELGERVFRFAVPTVLGFGEHAVLGDERAEEDGAPQ
jgi:hypothetical protein